MNIQELAKELYYQWDIGCTTPVPSWDLEDKTSKIGWDYLAKYVAIKILEARIEEIKLYRQLIDNGYRHNRISELEKQKQEIEKI